MSTVLVNNGISALPLMSVATLIVAPR
jgi:hypothetical protein